MAAGMRLSEATAQVTAALAALDDAVLSDLMERVTAIANGVAEGRAEVELEPAEVVERELRILETVLVSTEKNLQVLGRLRDRETRQSWAV